MKLFQSICLAVLLIGGPPVLITGCTGPQQRITYNTLFSIQQTGIKLYDSYLDLVIKRQVSPEDVPKVSRVFNNFQLAMGEAIRVANYNTNAPPTPTVIMAATQLTTAVTEAQAKKIKPQ